jgi:hypothetical protein
MPDGLGALLRDPNRVEELAERGAAISMSKLG